MRAPAARAPARPSSRTRSGSPIADNASTDATARRSPPAGRASCPRSRWCTWPRRAAGRALRARLVALGRRRCWPTWTWTCPPTSAALLPLVAPLISGHSDLAIGTRLARGSRVVRGAKREFISRGYNLMLRGTLAAPVLRRAVRLQGDPRATWPSSCCRWSRTPAGSSTPSCWCWPSGPGCASTRCRSTGSTTRTAGSTSWPPRVADLRGIARLGRGAAHGALPLPRCARSSAGRRSCAARRAGGACRQLLRFAAVGVLCTLAYLLLFALLRPARARRRRTSWPCWSPRSATPRPTGG